MARTVTVYGPPTSRPCTRNRPFSRVRGRVVKPVLRLTTRTSARATGWPPASVTLPVIAPVVTPWARSGGGASSIENTIAAATARGALTIQRIGGCLPCKSLRGDRCCATEQKVNRGGKRVKDAVLRPRFPPQPHARRAEQHVGHPRREGRRQRPALAHGLRQLEHEEIHESGREAHRHAPRGAAPGRGNRERRAE